MKIYSLLFLMVLNILSVAHAKPSAADDITDQYRAYRKKVRYGGLLNLAGCQSDPEACYKTVSVYKLHCFNGDSDSIYASIKDIVIREEYGAKVGYVVFKNGRIDRNDATVDATLLPRKPELCFAPATPIIKRPGVVE